MSRIVTVLVSLILVSLLVSGCFLDSSSSDQARIDRTAERLADVLTAQGFEVKRGYARLYEQEDCAYSYDVMGTCYGNNPAAPYVIFDVENWPGEYLDPATENAFGPARDGHRTMFRLDPREAVVILGKMPPPAAYFGLQTYLMTREGTFKTESGPYQYLTNFPAMLDTFFMTVPGNDQRVQVMASLGNSNNNVVMENVSGPAFDRDRYLVITPDRFMDTAVRQAFATIAVRDGHVFMEHIPSDAIVGLQPSADDFTVLMRYAMPQDGEDPESPASRWREALPFRVLRVRDTRSARPPEGYGPAVIDERQVLPEQGFRADLDRLVFEVARRWGQDCPTWDCAGRSYEFLDLQGGEIGLVGPDCIPIGMNCLADTQDTTYFGTFTMRLDRGEVYAVAGTLGTQTENATYVGLSVNESRMMKGVDNVNSETLADTAAAYASYLSDPSTFYLYYFARSCSGLGALTDGHCREVTEDMVAVCEDYTDPDCDTLKLAEREYIKPGTERGPDSTLMLLPRVLQLQRPVTPPE